MYVLRHADACTVSLERNTYASEKKRDGATPLFVAKGKDRADVYTDLLENNANVKK